MCTLTYLPVDGGYIFTHNRDERMDRPTSQKFQTKLINGSKVFYPEDLEAHGSWFGYSERGTAACLLNGGSKRYERNPPYRKSRGLVVLESFEFEALESFYEEYSFKGIEPFTLLIRSEKEFGKIVHNLNATHLEMLDPDKNQIWSSTTLYTKEVRDKRKGWFKDWLSKDPRLTPENVQRFHSNAGEGDTENDLVMSRWGFLRTLSITQITQGKSEAQLVYRDFIQESTDRLTLKLSR